jgi:hypothetical protein
MAPTDTPMRPRVILPVRSCGTARERCCSGSRNRCRCCPAVWRPYRSRY